MEDLKPFLEYSHFRNSDNSNRYATIHQSINDKASVRSNGTHTYQFTNDEDIRRVTKPRHINTNKYKNGSVLVIGGSLDYMSAPILCALAALRTCAGYATILMPKAAYLKLKFKTPGLIIKNLGIDKIVKRLKSIRHDSLAIGPGMIDKSVSAATLKSVIEYERD